MNVIKNDQRRFVTDFTDFEAPLVVGLELAPSQVPTPRFLCAGLFLGPSPFNVDRRKSQDSRQPLKLWSVFRDPHHSQDSYIPPLMVAKSRRGRF